MPKKVKVLVLASFGCLALFAKQLFSKRAGLPIMLYLLLVTTFLMFSYVSPAIASSCSGAGTKYNATAYDTESVTFRGVFTYDKPVIASLCGSSFSDGTYASLYSSMETSSSGDYLESGWYSGYNGNTGTSSLTYPAYYYIVSNFWNGKQTSDVSYGTGIYPHWGDVINITNNYDHSDCCHDYYKLVFYDTNSGVWIRISNIWVNGRGYLPLLQSETFSSVNALKGTTTSSAWMDTSKVWHNWASYQLIQAQGGQVLCVGAYTGSTNSFKFGYYSSGSYCNLP